jgi:hypothetical protein
MRAWMLAPIIAMIVIVRFGLTLPPGKRVSRYALTLVVVIIIGTIVFSHLPASVNKYLIGNGPVRWTYMSPNGGYLIAQRDSLSVFNPDNPVPTCFIRLSDGKKTVIQWPTGGFAWMGTNNDLVYQYKDKQLYIAILSKNGDIKTQIVDMPDPQQPYIWWHSGKETGYFDSTGKRHVVKVDD